MNRVLFRFQAFFLAAVVVGSVGGRAVSASSGAQEASELADRQGLVDRLLCVLSQRPTRNGRVHT
ncbi:MAG: hypothetical protein Ct9H300mP25_00040 [Acidobacteriota bacterium]|nr:MAG: hypothetical protein Ct9H300mP25_00040 [Acidobacteriota bacterium]